MARGVRIKFAIALMIVLVLSVCLSGCGKVMSDKEAIESGSLMVVAKSPDHYTIYVDRATKVMYVVGDGIHCPYTVMVNPDGTPRIWKGDL